jgi:hypothetical protein
MEKEGGPEVAQKEEGPDVAQLEHINTNQSDSPTGHDLKLERTLQHVDIENRFAFKGDDSDGKIEWNIRKLFASAFLAMLYTGTSRSSLFSARKCEAVTHTAQDRRFSFISLEAVSRLSSKTLEHPLARVGCRQPTLLLLLL